MSGSGLRRNLISAIATAIGALVLVLLLLEDPLVQFRLRTLAQEGLAAALDESSERLESGEPPDQVADEVGADHGVRIVVVLGDEVIGDTGFDGERLTRAHESLHEDTLAAFRAGSATPRVVADHHVAFRRVGDLVVQATLSVAATTRMRQSVRDLLLLGGIMAAVVGVLLTLVLSRTLVEPARELTRVADALAAGDLEARTESVREDEIGQIGRALDRMADQLAERMETLRVEQDFLRTVLDAMVEAVFVTDNLGRISQINEAFEALVDGDPRGRTAGEVVESAALHEAVRAARHGQPGPVELLLDRQGERRTLTAQVAPLPDGNGVVVVLHDVTSLRQADLVRRDFVANASHELRTPLTAIRGFAETLRDGAIEDPVASKRFLDVILKHTLRLQALVGDLSALSKAESPEHRLEIEPVDVQETIVEVVRGLTSKADQREIQLIVEPGSEPAWAMASERGLDQVLVNLVDNAIKYAPAKTAVRVSLKRAEGQVIVEVHDAGSGIPAEHHSRIFERFYRVDPGRSRDVGGTGLGLAIVKHLCQQMGAEVGLRSAPGQGATFVVTLRLTDPPGHEDALEASGEYDLPKRHTTVT